MLDLLRSLKKHVLYLALFLLGGCVGFWIGDQQAQVVAKQVKDQVSTRGWMSLAAAFIFLIALVICATGIKRAVDGLTTEKHGNGKTSKWTCTCGVVNTGKYCSACGEGKPAKWTCTCGVVNTGKYCSACGKQKPAKWICACGHANAGKFCESCGSSKP